jgi:hypothetical protein
MSILYLIWSIRFASSRQAVRMEVFASTLQFTILVLATRLQGSPRLDKSLKGAVIWKFGDGEAPRLSKSFQDPRALIDRAEFSHNREFEKGTFSGMAIVTVNRKTRIGMPLTELSPVNTNLCEWSAIK